MQNPHLRMLEVRMELIAPATAAAAVKPVTAMAEFYVGQLT